MVVVVVAVLVVVGRKGECAGPSRQHLLFFNFIFLPFLSLPMGTVL